MKKIVAFMAFAALLPGCSFGENQIAYDPATKTISVVTADYHLKSIQVEEYIGGKVNKEMASSIDFDQQVTSASLLDLEGHGKLYGKPMAEFLENKNLLYTVIIEHNVPQSQEMPLDIISFSSEQLTNGKQIFDSGNRP